MLKCGGGEERWGVRKNVGECGKVFWGVGRCGQWGKVFWVWGKVKRGVGKCVRVWGK